MYAILDIETTGGKYNEEGITEIAIYRFDGHEIVDQFASLINPERPIQPYVVKLTGITNEMLIRAPKFYQVAKRIIEITEGCILVAHNALFDTRILREEFSRLGYDFQRESLCTVELSQKLLPNLPSYNLEKLTKYLGIPLVNRHRAQGDAQATVALFKLLLSKDTAKNIISQTLKTNEKLPPEPRLIAMAERAPSKVGIYFLYNIQNRIIYIGRAKNIRKRLLQHFTYDNRKSKRLQKEVASVSFELTGNELIARLAELEAVRATKALYNRRPNGKKIYTHQLSLKKEKDGYLYLELIPADGRKSPILTFNNFSEAVDTLETLSQDNAICLKKTNLKNPNHISKCCDEDVTTYNQTIHKFIEEKSLYKKNALLLLNGRNVEERSVIWVARGKVKGFGFFNLNHQITKSDILNNILNTVSDVPNATHIVQQYLLKNKFLKVINLDDKSNQEMLKLGHL
ncbi:MAG: GIY-YIG nuclease family protein [Bacteroidetes bacterium]|nr:GIY-YIG nuclease family protein [Bacteroidota bacterium]